jgi:hypothetical protein
VGFLAKVAKAAITYLFLIVLRQNIIESLLSELENTSKEGSDSLE